MEPNDILAYGVETITIIVVVVAAYLFWSFRDILKPNHRQ